MSIRITAIGFSVLAALSGAQAQDLSKPARLAAVDALGRVLPVEAPPASAERIDSAFAASVNLPGALHLIGTDGAISIHDFDRLTVIPPKGAPELIDLSGEDGEGGLGGSVGAWLGNVMEAIRTGTQIAPSFDDGLAAALVIDRLKADAVRVGA